ncbi:hypothetical protein ACRTEC_16570 [Janibacter indicus]
MSVASMLGLDDPHSGLLEVAQTRWPVWQAEHAALLVTDDLTALRQVVRRRGRTDANEVLAALVKQGSAAGGNEAAATAVAVWLLLPGASLMAARLRRQLPLIGAEVDQLVAGQVWIEARCVRESTNYAATILLNAERAIRAEQEMSGRSAKARRKSVLTAPADLDILWAVRFVRDESPLGVSPEVELQRLLVRSIRRGVITAVDARLLLDVAHTADELAARSARPVGLMSGAVSQAVAVRYGCSDRAVRRRTHSIITSLRSVDACSIGRSA